MSRFIGVDIGGTKCAVVLGDENGRILNKVKFPTEDYNTTIGRITDAVLDMGNADAIGINCGGPLDPVRGLIMSPPNLPGWDNIPIVRMLGERTGMPVFLCNDANACALAEWKFGAGRGTENMIFLTCGTGMGAGLILNGKLYSGTCDMAGEVGHMRLERFGPVGFGKSGSFEGFCSGGGIAQIGRTLAREQIQVGKTTGYCENLTELESVTAKSIADAAHTGDPTAIEVYRLCGEKLGYALSLLIDIFNPECIVIGSIFERSGELMRDAMDKVINAEALEYSRKVCRIVPAALGDGIGDAAAIAIAVMGVENNEKR